MQFISAKKDGLRRPQCVGTPKASPRGEVPRRGGGVEAKGIEYVRKNKQL